MLKNVNKLKNVDACLHFIENKCLLTKAINQTRHLT